MRTPVPILAVMLLFLAGNLPASAQDGTCGCEGQKTRATGHEACSATDLPKLCTIVFGQTRNNIIVSQYLTKFGLNVPALSPRAVPPPASNGGTSFEDEVNRAFQVLNQPQEQLLEDAKSAPRKFAGTLYFALVSSVITPIQGRIPPVIYQEELAGGRVGKVIEVPTEEYLRVLRTVLVEKYAEEITEAFFTNSFKEEEGGGDYHLAISNGCLAVSLRVMNVTVRAVWSRNPNDRCRG